RLAVAERNLVRVPLRAVPRGGAARRRTLRGGAAHRERPRHDRRGGERRVGSVRAGPRARAAPRRAAAGARASRRTTAAAGVIARQHVWLGPEATTFSEPCEACLRTRERQQPAAHSVVSGSLRRDADVG